MAPHEISFTPCPPHECVAVARKRRCRAFRRRPTAALRCPATPPKTGSSVKVKPKSITHYARVFCVNHHLASSSTFLLPSFFPCHQPAWPLHIHPPDRRPPAYIQYKTPDRPPVRCTIDPCLPPPQTLGRRLRLLVLLLAASSSSPPTPLPMIASSSNNSPPLPPSASPRPSRRLPPSRRSSRPTTMPMPSNSSSRISRTCPRRCRTRASRCRSVV